jgi:hypothetical protein
MIFGAKVETCLASRFLTLWEGDLSAKDFASGHEEGKVIIGHSLVMSKTFFSCAR